MRAVVSTVVLFALFALSASADLEKYTFANFVDEYARSYSGAEYTKREKVFNENLNTMKRHNADPAKTYTQGVNHFSDWTQEEFRSYNRARLNRKALEAADKIYPAPTAEEASALPKYVDWRLATNPPVLTGVKNQGHCGGCWGFSATEGVESYFALLTGQLPVLAPQQVISCTTTVNGCGGGFISSGWDYLKTSTGLNEEWLYPFTNFFCPAETKAATAACQNITKDFLPTFPWWPKAGVTGRVAVTPNSGSATAAALAQSGPQSISVAASTWMNYKGGIFVNNKSDPSTGVWGIDHAVQLVGYGYDYDLKMDYWIVRNSWGTQWGENGFIRLARYPGDEPCGTDPYTFEKVCGTSGVLSGPEHPIVKTLKKKNL